MRPHMQFKGACRAWRIYRHMALVLTKDIKALPQYECLGTPAGYGALADCIIVPGMGSARRHAALCKGKKKQYGYRIEARLSYRKTKGSAEQITASYAAAFQLAVSQGCKWAVVSLEEYRKKKKIRPEDAYCAISKAYASLEDNDLTVFVYSREPLRACYTKEDINEFWDRAYVVGEDYKDELDEYAKKALDEELKKIQDARSADRLAAPKEPYTGRREYKEEIHATEQYIPAGTAVPDEQEYPEENEVLADDELLEECAVEAEDLQDIAEAKPELPPKVSFAEIISPRRPQRSYAMQQGAGGGLQDMINAKKSSTETFSQMLLRLIDESGMTDAECYRKANIDRRHFSKIRSDKDYKPSKGTVFSFAIALQLTMPETRKLLAAAGYAITYNSVSDILIEYFIQQGMYDIYIINSALFDYDQQPLGV